MASTFESVFEFLFKYRPWVFEKGQFALAATWPLYLVGLAIVVVAVPTLLRYRDVRGKSQPRTDGSSLPSEWRSSAWFSFACFVRFWSFRPSCPSGVSWESYSTIQGA